MPAYNFSARFAADVESGRKRQTIRRRRKRPTKTGDKLHLFIGMRTRSCRTLGKAVCAGALPLLIDEGRVILNGDELRTLDALTWFAAKDGFQTWADCESWFREHYGLPFDDGELIWW